MNVPKPPVDQIILLQEDVERLRRWIEFFRKLSPRITVIQPRDNEFEGFLEKAERLVKSKKQICDDTRCLVGWPKEDKIAFVLMVDSAEPGSIVEKKEISDLRFFCFGDLAFGATYFSWDGDEENYLVDTYSLSDFSPNALTWEYVTSLIIGQIGELETRVPPPPE